MLKTIGAALAIVVAAAIGVAVFALLAAGPTMLVLGALHSSDGLSWVPALGFWQTLGSLFVIGSVGRAFNASTTVKES